MEQRHEPSVIEGSPELALVLFGILAAFAYILL